MANLLEQGLLLGLGALDITREKVEQLLDELVRQGKVQREEGKKLVAEILERGEKQRQELQATIKSELKGLLEQSELVSRRDLERLEARVTALEEQVLPTGLKVGTPD